MKKRKKLGRDDMAPKADSWAMVRAWRDSAINASGVRGPEDRKEAGRLFDDYRKEFLVFEKDPRAAVAKAMHTESDDRIEPMKDGIPDGRTISCMKGCSACCYQRVDATPVEIALLTDVIRRGGLKIDMERLNKQSGLSLNEFRSLPHQDKACVFLDANGLCSVYEERPAVCRKWMVVSPPKWCDIEKSPGHKVLMIKNVYTEVLHFAAGSVFGMGSLATMLLKELSNEKSKSNEHP